jgi:hypothetical protein
MVAPIWETLNLFNVRADNCTNTNNNKGYKFLCAQKKSKEEEKMCEKKISEKNFFTKNCFCEQKEFCYNKKCVTQFVFDENSCRV